MKELINFFSGIKLFIVSLCVVGYFCFLMLDYYLIHIENKFIIHIIRFFGEMITFPLLFLVQPALLILSIFCCVKEKFRIKSWSFWSFLILLISNVFFIGSFIFPFN